MSFHVQVKREPFRSWLDLASKLPPAYEWQRRSSSYTIEVEYYYQACDIGDQLADNGTDYVIYEPGDKLPWRT